LFANVACDDFVLAQTFDHFLIECAQLAEFFLKHLFDIIPPAIANIVEANKSSAVPFRIAFAHRFKQRRLDHVGDLTFVERFCFAANLADSALLGRGGGY